MNDRLLGILGGMGSLATVEFLRKLVMLTPAQVDQDHVRYILYNDPSIPDRNEFFKGIGNSPVPAVIEGLKFLERSGVEAIGVPCNTVHIWFDQFEESVKCPIFNIVNETVNDVLKRQLRKVLLLGTETLIKSSIYQRELESVGVSCVVPQDMNYMMKAIQAVKGNRLKEARGAIIEPLRKQISSMDVDGVIIACTELPIILNEEDFPITVIDSDVSLARSLVSSYFRSDTMRI